MKLDEFYPENVSLENVQVADRFFDQWDRPLLPIPTVPLNCPYCLWEGRINDFLLWKKESIGFLKRSVQCPDCKNILRRNTLVQCSLMDLDEYANWLYSVKQFDVDRRIKWQSLFRRLKERNVSEYFWGRYREIKRIDMEKKGLALAQKSSLVSDPDILIDPES